MTVLNRFGTPPCPNLNHRRHDAPVSHCPQCGEIVNVHIRATKCNAVDHDTARRDHHMFCMHCGQRLISPR